MPDFGPHNNGDLTGIFETVRKLPPAETLEQIRHHYFTAALMHDSGEQSIGGLNINMSGRQDSAYLNNDKKKRQNNHTAFLLMISNMTIEQMENRLTEQYGENFAENLAAEYLDEDTYKRLMSIDDKDERRRQIAIELNQGIRDGSIDADKIYGNPDFKDWLEVRDIEEQHRALEQTQASSRSDIQSGDQITNNSKIEDHHSSQQNAALETGFDKILGR